MVDQNTPYTLQYSPKTVCARCVEKRVDLLADENMEGPMFYVCRACGHIAQVGVGPVERFKET